MRVLSYTVNQSTFGSRTSTALILRRRKVSLTIAVDDLRSDGERITSELTPRVSTAAEAPIDTLRLFRHRPLLVAIFRAQPFQGHRHPSKIPDVNWAPRFNKSVNGKGASGSSLHNSGRHRCSLRSALKFRAKRATLSLRPRMRSGRVPCTHPTATLPQRGRSSASDRYDS